MTVSHSHATKAEFSENGRRIEAQSVADLFQRLAGGVILDRLVDLHLTHAPWSLADASPFKVFAHRNSIDPELLGYLMDSHAAFVGRDQP